MNIGNCKTKRNYIYLSGFFNYNEVVFSKLSSKTLGNYFEPHFFKLPYNYSKDLMNNYLPNYFYSNFRNIIFPELKLTSFLFSNTEYPPMGQVIDKIRLLKLTKLSKRDVNNSVISIVPKEQKIDFCINSVDYYFFPNSSGIFSIKIILSDDQTNLNTISDFLNSIRNLDSKIQLQNKKKLTMKEYINSKILFTIDNLKLFECLSDSDFNNKLKIFNVIELNDPLTDIETQTNILYDIGTVSPIRDNNTKSFFTPSKKYIDELIEQNGLFIFENWASLNLLDTKTIISFEPNDGYGIYENAETYYFPIYIYNLYHKLCLIDFSTQFTNMGRSYNYTKELRDSFIRFRNIYDLPKISYNFLPEKINQKMRYALDIDDELIRMDERIEKIHSFIQERQDKKTNMILTVLSILSVSSLFIDFFNWFQKYFNIPEKFHSLTNIGVTGTLIFLIFALLYLFNKRE